MSRQADGLDARLEAYRSLRHELERAVVPLATSVDGRRFTFQASLHDLAFQSGGYVVLENGSEPRLGQVITLESASREGPELAVDLADDVSAHSQVLLRYAQGEGVVLAGDGAPFHDAMASPARPDEVAAWLERTRPPRAILEVGELVLAPGVRFALDAGGFDRHTFLCGQSGSGKTYSLGLVLERLLLETDLRIVILDPNSDFVRLGDVRDGADGELASRYGGRGGRGLGPVAAGRGEPLQLAFPELDSAAQAAVLRLDPIADREEYAALTAALDEWKPSTLDGARRPRAERTGAASSVAPRTSACSTGASGRAAPRARSCGTRPTATSAASSSTSARSARARSRRSSPRRSSARLWERRADRSPVLIVIDEAHNVCPAEPEDAADRARHGARRAHRRRGPEVRPLPARLDPAAAEGARERAQPVRQPAPDAHELGRRPRLRRRRLLVRAPEPARAGDDVPPGRGARRREDLAASGAPPLRRRASARRAAATSPPTGPQGARRV